MSTTKYPSANTASELSGTQREAPGRSVHRKAQPYPRSEWVKDAEGETIKLWDEATRAWYKDLVERFPYREHKHQKAQHNPDDCQMGEDGMACLKRKLEMAKNQRYAKVVDELVKSPKKPVPWSPAETPSGRKLMKEGDSPFHFDSHKPMVEQVPPRALMAVAKVFTYGAKKYGDHNWARYYGEWKWSQLMGSALRHLYAWMMREDLDPESGLPHLDHAAANLLMLIEIILAGNKNDNRNPIGN